LHSDLGDALENLIFHIRSRRDADGDGEYLVPIHTVLLHICRPPTCPVVQHRLQTDCPIIRFLIVNSLKSDTSSTNFAFEHIRRVTGPVAIFQYWWKCTILMQLMRPMCQPNHPPSRGAKPTSGSLAFARMPKTHRSADCGRPCTSRGRCRATNPASRGSFGSVPWHARSMVKLSASTFYETWSASYSPRQIR
jgi:hypothetical protein